MANNPTVTEKAYNRLRQQTAKQLGESVNSDRVKLVVMLRLQQEAILIRQLRGEHVATAETVTLNEAISSHLPRAKPIGVDLHIVETADTVACPQCSHEFEPAKVWRKLSMRPKNVWRRRRLYPRLRSLLRLLLLALRASTVEGQLPTPPRCPGPMSYRSPLRNVASRRSMPPRSRVTVARNHGMHFVPKSPPSDLDAEQPDTCCPQVLRLECGCIDQDGRNPEQWFQVCEKEP